MKKIFADILAAAVTIASAGMPAIESNTVFAGFVIEKDTQTAMEKNKEAVLAALKSMVITNDITKDELENIVMGASDYSANEYVGAGIMVEDFKLTKATESKDGLMKANVMIFQDDGEVGFEVRKEIPALGGTSAADNNREELSNADVQKSISKALDSFKATNASNEQDVLEAVNDTIFKFEGVSVTIDSFELTKATQSAAGSADIKYTVTFSDGSRSTFRYTCNIQKLTSTSPKEEVAAAKKAINDAIWKFEVSNDTSKDDILNMAKKSLPAGSNVVVALDNSDFSIIKASTTVNGTVSATLTLSCDDITERCSVAKTIESIVTESSSKIAEDIHAMSTAIRAMKYTNRITKEDMLKTALAEVKNGSSAQWESFTKKNSDFKEDGEIIGYLKVTLNEETRSVRIREVIPKIICKMPSDKISINKEEWEILRLTNIERAKEGEFLLTATEVMQEVCDVREQELLELYSHTRPNGKKCFTAIPSTFNHSGLLGENIYEFCTPGITGEKSVKAWMDSPGHRANILTEGFAYMGVGCIDTGKEGRSLQMFASWKQPIESVETSAGTFNFEDEDALQKEYLICTSSDGIVSYMPLDINSMTKSGNKYTAKIRKADYVVFTVGEGGENSENVKNENSKDEKTNTGNENSAVPVFDDVKSDAYYAEAVKWAVGRQITNGTSETTFSPSDTCTRAQILTFLWRAVGSPVLDKENPFTDVNESDYYYNAAVWASEKGMVEGSTFNGNTPCTRSSTVTYIWKNAGAPETAVSNVFSDVSENSEYAQAVAWAVKNGVTSGTSDTEFSPANICDRGQIVTFLNRALNK